jgi:hypothetical protein
MASRWSGFVHPHLDVTYSISIGTSKGGDDVISMQNVGTSLSHKETGLTLTPYQVSIVVSLTYRHNMRQ